MKLSWLFLSMAVAAYLALVGVAHVQERKPLAGQSAAATPIQAASSSK